MRFTYKPQPITNQEGRPTFSRGVYELGDRFGTYRSVGSFAKIYRGTIPKFQTPHLGRSLRLNAEKDMQIVELF
jgi:hypothetical protein